MKFSGLEIIDVYVVSVVEGIGTEEDPCRIVTSYMKEDENGRCKTFYKDDPQNALDGGGDD